MATLYLLKVYFPARSRKEEHIRKFEIDVSAEKDPYRELCEKVKTYQADLQDHEFCLQYIDGEKEHITFSSNEELRTAIKMDENSKPLKIIVVGNKAKTTKASKDRQEGESHADLSCNICKQPLFYANYECLVCAHCSPDHIHRKENLINIGMERPTDSVTDIGENGQSPKNSSALLFPRPIRKLPGKLRFESSARLSKRHNSRNHRKNPLEASESSDATRDKSSDEDESSSSTSSGSTLQPPLKPMTTTWENVKRKKQGSGFKLPSERIRDIEISKSSESTTAGMSADVSSSSIRRSEEISLDSVIRFLEAFRSLQNN